MSASVRKPNKRTSSRIELTPNTPTDILASNMDSLQLDHDGFPKRSKFPRTELFASPTAADIDKENRTWELSEYTLNFSVTKKRSITPASLSKRSPTKLKPRETPARKVLSFGGISSSCQVSVDTVDFEYSVPDTPFPVLSNSNVTDGCQRISVETLADVIQGKFSDKIQSYLIIDCRFDYEHQGGHITKAVNILHKEQLKDLFETTSKSLSGSKTAIVFHCEYSKHRAPKACKFWRELDRKKNKYPLLAFPHLFVLDGGYKRFHEEFAMFCEPGGYVSMFDERFRNECKSLHARYRKSWGSTIL